MSMSFGYFVLQATVSNKTHYTIYRQSPFEEYRVLNLDLMIRDNNT